MVNERTFNEEQIRDVIKRAAEIQAASSSRGGASQLTLQELEEAAESAGVDPGHVRQAVREMDAARVTGGKTETNRSHIFVERWVSRPMTDDMTETIQTELSHRLGVPVNWSIESPFEWCSTKQIGDTWELTHREFMDTKLRVSVRPHGDQTHVRLAEKYSVGGYPVLEAMAFSAALAGVSVPILMAASVAPVWIVTICALIFMVASPAIYAGLTMYKRSKQESLETLADQVCDAVVGSEAPSGSARATVASKQTQPTSDTEEVSSESGGQPSPRSRTRV